MSAQRRTKIVEGFQLQFVLTLLVWLAFWLLVLAALLIGPLVWDLTRSAPRRLDESAAALLTLHSRLWLPAGVMFLGLLVTFIRVSHRVAGPLYRFRQIFGRVAGGDLTTPVRVRAGDYLQREAAELEDMVAAIRDRACRAKAASLALRTSLDDLAGRVAIPGDAWPRLAAHARNLETALSEWVTDPPEVSPAPALPTAPRRESDAGFSLIELLIVTCVMSVISAMAVPAYQSALDRARVARAIGDISAIGKDVMMFQLARGCLPGSLADIGHTATRDPWKRPYAYAVARSPGGGGRGGGGGGGSCQACGSACVPPGAARKDKNLVPINSDFDLYSAGKDGATSAPLTAKGSQDDIIRARDGGFIGRASTY